MAYAKVQTEGAKKNRYIKMREQTAGSVLVDGTYVESYKGEYGLNYKFTDGEEDKFVVIGSKNLDQEMAAVQPGSKVRITYVKPKLIKTGPWAGKTTYQFLVEVDTSGAVI